MTRRCTISGCSGVPSPFDLECDRHPACRECGGHGMHDLRCTVARAERLVADRDGKLRQPAEEEEPRIVY